MAVEDNFIKGNDVFKSVLKEHFFQKYFDRKICKSSIFNYFDEENSEFYYCSKNINLTDFNNIILTIDGTNLTIELNYKDLFIEYNDNYYFIIYFPVKYYSYMHFRLGKILFKKYMLSFNYDSKRIGYYKTKTNNNKIPDKKGTTYYYLIPWIIIAVLVIIIIILCVIILYYKPWKNRQKRANELKDDNYCYEGINE